MTEPILLGTKRDGSAGGFWATRVELRTANDARTRLGLAHYDKPDEMYRVAVVIDGARPAYIPTCADANAYHAWRRPGSGHTEPWGLTLDLATGKAAEPELLLEDHPSDSGVALYVGKLSGAPPGNYLMERLRP